MKLFDAKRELGSTPIVSKVARREIRYREPELEPTATAEIPLPGSDWAKVLDLANSALTLFKGRGYQGASPVKESVRHVSAAIQFIEEGRGDTALFYLRQAEIALSKVSGESTMPSKRDHILYGCRLAVQSIKESVSRCLHGIVTGDRRDLIKAQLSLEDAAMCVLSARQRESV